VSQPPGGSTVRTGSNDDANDGGHRSQESASPFQEFFRTEAAAGLLLVVCAATALVLANSRFADAYQRLWTLPVSVSAGGHGPALTLHQWINDGLMAVFFLLVGLEIKREVLAGELASLRHAALPIAGAVGGMLVPAILYALTSDGGAAARGWAIPMATDIAFALGVLALVAPNAPAGLKIFLAALAIVDDMGAVLVIALFYTAHVAWPALGGAAVILAALVAMNLFKVRHLAPYLALGVGLWFFVHESGIHATIAGVLVAFAIPTRTRINAAEYSREARALLNQFDQTETGDLMTLTSKGQQDAIVGLERACEAVTPPLLRLEHALQRFCAFIVMPLFAFSNAGVTLSGSMSADVMTPVVLGLVIGKPLGITVAAVMAARWRIATLPEGVTWRLLHGCTWLAGIGFTMSLFIATLAFEGTELLDSAKGGILGGSLIAGAVGAWLIRAAGRSS
jgi:Na+:H+ antiporter, NhaA family